MVPGEEAFRFRHILIRDAAYQAIPKERRADLHEGFAAWIGRVGGDRAEEQDEIVGYHLEQAFRYRQELGPLDDQARALARQASDRLAAAGSRAHTRHDMRAVANLLGRAEALLDPSDPARLALLPDLSEALWEGGLTEEATALTSEFRALAEDLGDPELIAYATLSGWWLRGELERPLDLARSDAQDAIRVFEASGDERGLARAWHVIASIEWDLGQAGKQLDALEHALDHAGRARASFETEEALFSVTSAIVRGPIAVPEAIARAEGIIGEFPDNRGMEAYMGHALAHLRARLGAFDAAREEVDRYRGFLLDTGQLNAYWRVGRGAVRRRDARRRRPGRGRGRRGGSREAERAGRSMAVPVRVPRASEVRTRQGLGGIRGRRDRRIERQLHRTRAGPGRARAHPGSEGRRGRSARR